MARRILSVCKCLPGFCTLLLGLVWCGWALAVPTAVPYFGHLSFSSGVPYQGTVDVQVQVWSADSGGSSLWGPHLFESVPVQDGIFSILLGGASSPDLQPALDSGQALWLAFAVGGTPLLPRQQVLSVPFARRAERAADAAKLGGVDASQFARTSDLALAALSGSYNDLVDTPENQASASGSAGAIAVFTASSALGASVVSQSDGKVGVGVSNPQSSLHASGGITVGPDAGACTSARAGTLRWTGSAIEVCNGTIWAALAGAAPIAASGGTVTEFIGNGTNGINGVTYRVHTFTSSGTFAVASAGTSGSVEYLAVGGGGGGGACYGAGGGAGGLLQGSLTVVPGSNYAVTVGAGGGGTTAGNGASGGNSSIVLAGSALATAIGGGGGGGACGNVGLNGGSGGGGSGNGSSAGGLGTSGQGNSGGSAWSAGGGGGGGAGAAGVGRTPGPGLSSSIRGIAAGYAGGGGGGSCDAGIGVADMPGGFGGGGSGGKLNAGQGDGAANTGGGGGGTCQTACSGGNSCRSGNGGSGIVVIRYPLTGTNL